MPGSLIFVVIVAIWAAYLLQHWVRRREDAASTRSADGFSQAMRVLPQRGAVPAVDGADPRARPWSFGPRRSARAAAEVTLATPASGSRPPGARRSPLIARRRADRVQITTEARPMAETQSTTDTTDTTAADSSGEAASTKRATPPRVVRPSGVVSRLLRPRRAGAAASTLAPRTTRSSGAEAGSRPVVSLAQRRLRGGLLIVSLLWVPVSVGLAATGRLMWLSVPFAVLTFGAVLVWLRATAQADRARSADLDLELQAYEDDLVQPELTSDDTQVIDAGTGRAQAGPAAYDTDDASRPQRDVALFDIEALDVPAAPAAAAEPPAPGTWQPVPVPRPTYALKAKAEPRLTPTGVPADVFETPEFADEAGELDERALFARRAVGS